MTEAQVIFRSGASMVEIPDGSAALVLTSPPYFPENLEPRLREGALTAEEIDLFDQQIRDFAVSLRPVFSECVRVLSSTGAVVLQTRDVRLQDRLVAVESIHRMLLETLGLVLHARYLWRPAHTTLPRLRQHTAAMKRATPRPFDPEMFLLFKHPGEHLHGSPLPEDLELLASDVAQTTLGHLPAAHRFQAPIPMVAALIRSFSAEGDLVVDPFAGGGTTLFVAKSLARRAIGYEISREAVQLAQRNLEEHS